MPNDNPHPCLAYDLCNRPGKSLSCPERGYHECQGTRQAIRRAAQNLGAPGATEEHPLMIHVDYGQKPLQCPSVFSESPGSRLQMIQHIGTLRTPGATGTLEVGASKPHFPIGNVTTLFNSAPHPDLYSLGLNVLMND